MRGVGKFHFKDGEEYLGCWLAPGGSGQMARRMSALKRHTLEDMLHKPPVEQPAVGPPPSERLSLNEMPDAVQALRGALLSNGLAFTQTNGGAGGGAQRAAGSLKSTQMGVRQAPRLPTTAASQERSPRHTRLLAAAAGGLNPLEDVAISGVIINPTTPTLQMVNGPPSHSPQQKPGSMQHAGMKSMDLSSRFGGGPSGGGRTGSRLRPSASGPG